MVRSAFAFLINLTSYMMLMAKFQFCSNVTVKCLCILFELVICYFVWKCMNIFRLIISL